MSKQLFFAFLLAVFGVSVATLQICRFNTPRNPGGGRRIEQPPFVFDESQIPRVEGRLPQLRVDAALARKLDAADDHLAAESWVEAIHVLQGLLDSGEDALVPVQRVGRSGLETTAWTGLRAEAARLLDTLPVDGRSAYQTIYGPRAQALLAQARYEGDIARVSEVARRFVHTAAGSEALALLGIHHLDRGRPGLAASCFQRLLFRPNTGPIAAETLIYAVLAFRAAGNDGPAQEAWRKLVAQAPRGLRLNDKELALGELREVVDTVPFGVVAAAATGPQSLRNLEHSWTVSTAHEAHAKKGLESAAQHFEGRARALTPTFVPITAKGMVYFRSHLGIHAVDGRTGRPAWQAPSPWSLDGMMADNDHRPHMQRWIDGFVTASPYVLFENGVVGTLSTDGARVYAVDDLGIPPYPSTVQRGGRGMPLPDYPEYGPRLAEAVQHNRLQALDGATGRLLWSAGGRGDSAVGPEFADCYFLGPPLHSDGRLYVVVERNSELHVICLDVAGRFLWKQFLTIAPFQMLLDPGRRIQPAMPVLSDGILVCPTNAGVVVGVDVLAQSLAWAYTYPTEPLTQAQPATWGRRSMLQPPQTVSEWRSPSTNVDNGRVIVAPPDDPSIHCLNLRDGSLIWKVGPRNDDDLYVAGVFGNQVLVAGKKSCRSLDLATGKQRWQLDTGTPSGRGVARGSIYFLPLKSAALDQAPAVVAIDVRQGLIVEHARLPRWESPGNLLFWQEGVVSQTGMTVSGFLGPKERIQ